MSRTVKRAFRYRFYPTDVQAAELIRTFGCVRLVYNMALAARTGARYHVSADDPVRYERHPVRDGDVIEVSPSMTLTAIATPGHTFTHLSYALTSCGEDVGVFTGGSLLFGSTGRPDLLGPEHTEALVHAQYASAHRLADRLADSAEVFPTHGFGSFCSSTQSDATSSTKNARITVMPRSRRPSPQSTIASGS